MPKANTAEKLRNHFKKESRELWEIKALEESKNDRKKAIEKLKEMQNDDSGPEMWIKTLGGKKENTKSFKKTKKHNKKSKKTRRTNR